MVIECYNPQEQFWGHLHFKDNGSDQIVTLASSFPDPFILTGQLHMEPVNVWPPLLDESDDN